MSDSSTGKPSFPVLAKNNYNEWAGNCRASLMTHGYWKLVSGKELKPSATEELNKWETKSDKAAGLIYLAVGNVGGIDTVEVTQRFNAQCGVFNASLLSQTSSSNVVSLKLLCLRHSLITIYND